MWWRYRYKDRVPLQRFLWVLVLAWWPAFVVCGRLIWLMLQTDSLGGAGATQGCPRGRSPGF